MITLTTGGCTFKHKEPAKPGHLWVTINEDKEKLVCITQDSEHYIYFQPMNNIQSETGLHKSVFYSLFKKVE